jgi:hypothetical protein
MERHARTVVARIKLLADATRLQPDLTPEMAALLEDYPEELRAPKHPSQLAFEAALIPGSLGSSARGRASARGQAQPARAKQARVMPSWREAERAAVAAEAKSRAPWKAAIAFARAARRARRVARAAARAAAKTRGGQTNTMQPENAAAVPGCRAQKPGSTVELAGTQRPESASKLAETNPLYLELAFRAAGLRARPGAPADAGRPDAASAAIDVNPMQRHSAGAGPPPGCCPGASRNPGRDAGGGATPARLMSTKAAALRSTTLGKTWTLAELRAELERRFGPAQEPMRWQPPQASLIGSAARIVEVVQTKPIQREDR